MADATLKMLLLGEDRGMSSSLKGAGDAAEKTEGKTKKLSGSLTGLVKGFLAFTAVEKATEFLKGSAEAAEENESSMKILGKQMHNTAGATDEQVRASEDWITKASLQTGVAKNQLIPAFTQLVTATGDVGKAQRLTSLAMDVSADTHKNLTTVTNALAKAQEGNVGGLSRLGIATKDASGHTKTFAELQGELAEKFKGDASAAADTQAGKMQRLGAAYEEVKEQVGNALLPVLGHLSDWLVDVIPKVEGFFSEMQAGQGVPGAIAGELSDLGKAVGKVGEFVSHNKAAVATFIGVLAGFSIVSSIAKGFVALDAAMDANPIGIVVIAVAALAAGLVYAYKHSETFRSVVQTTFHAIAEAGRFMWNDILEPVLKLMLTAFAAVAKAGAHMLEALGHVPGFGWAKDAGEALGKVADAAHDVGDHISKIPDSHDTKITGDHSNADAAVLSATQGINSIPGSHTTDINGDKSDAKSAIDWTNQNVAGLPGSHNTDLKGDKSDAQSAITWVSDAVKGLPTSKTIQLTIQVAAHVAASAAGAAGAAHHASGGRVSAPTWVGESGPEMFVPDSAGRIVSNQTLADAAGQAANNGGGDLGTVTLRLEGDDGREIQRKLLKFRRVENGGIALGLG